MLRTIRERIARRRLLLGGAAAGVGMWAGTARRATAEGASLPGGATRLDTTRPPFDAADMRVAGAGAPLPQTDQVPPARWGFSPINRRPAIAFPNGARVAFWIGYNIEYFVPGRPGTSITQSTANLEPDPLNAGWREYGHRVGVWRMMDMLDKYNMRASVLLNSDVCLHYPEIIEEGNKRRWAWLAHGKTNTNRWTNMTLEEERAALAEVLGTIRQYTGQEPKGWLGPALGETYNTLDLMAEQGMTYTCDWCNDDQPYPVRVRQGRMISVPYSIELNDISLFIGKTVSGQDFYDIVTDQFDVLYEEGAQRPRVMCLALHPMIVNQPFRHKHLDRALGYITSHDRVWLPTSDEIADWYYANYYAQAVAQGAFGPPPGTAPQA
jgi:allantoinase